MGMTNAQRQKQYRESRTRAGENGERLLTAYVSTGAWLACKRLARHHHMTQRDLLEKLLNEAQEQATAGMGFDSPEYNAFFEPVTA